MNPNFAYPFLHWDRWYGNAEGVLGQSTPGQLCSWSFTAEHVQSAVTCEPAYVPRGEPIITATVTPYEPPYVPVIPVDSVPAGVPVTVTPEPATWILFGLGVAVVLVVKRVRR